MSNVRRIAILDETGLLPTEVLPPLESVPAPHSHAEYATDADLSNHAGLTHGLTSHAVEGAFHTGTEVIPTTGQKNAMAGTQGIPGSLNPYVTTQDPRLSDARTPLPHPHADGDLPLGIARDSEVTAAVAAHAATPHGGSPFVRKAADQAFTAIALADVADLAVPLGANADIGFEFLIVWQSAATTTGVQFALNGPAGLVELTALVEVQLTQTTWQTAVHTAYNGGAVTASIDAANARRIARIKGVIRNGATAGNLILRCRTEVANSAITVKRGSFATYV